jgi:hypothetical protein
MLKPYLSTTGETIIPDFTEKQAPWTDPPTKLNAPFVTLPGFYAAECRSDEDGVYLAVIPQPRIGDQRTGGLVGDWVQDGKRNVTMGLHLIDLNLVMGNLIDVLRDQSDAWCARPRVVCRDWASTEKQTSSIPAKGRFFPLAQRRQPDVGVRRREADAPNGRDESKPDGLHNIAPLANMRKGCKAAWTSRISTRSRRHSRRSLRPNISRARIPCTCLATVTLPLRLEGVAFRSIPDALVANVTPSAGKLGSLSERPQHRARDRVKT